MTRRLIIFAVAAIALSVASRAQADPVELNDAVVLVPATYRHRLVQQLSLAEENEQTWLDAIVAAKPEHREAMAYLLTNMPPADLKALKGPFLVHNVDLAYQAREATPWGRAVPLELFFKDVLPYANVDERRDDWRQDYHDQFMPLVKDCKTATEAAQLLNKRIFKTLKVKYHATLREKPNQSPYESAKIGYASCTGLTIMLSDACRAVGVPARLVGTPMWSDGSGNHTWTEIWDQQWYFVGAAEPGKLNQTWFGDNAAKADDKPEHRIYAASFEQTKMPFPMVWTPEPTDAMPISSQDVTGYYTGRKHLTITCDPGQQVVVRLGSDLVAAAPTGAKPVRFELAAGQTYTVQRVDGQDKVTATKTVLLPKEADAVVTLP